MPSNPPLSAAAISRKKIPWFPTIDTSKCDGCGACFKFCHTHVYDWDEERQRPLITNPFSCVLGCSGCQPICERGAIFFPDLEEIAALIRRLRTDGSASPSKGNQS
jgi:NAD-dependent dihydropyrimidine dehydrogenase PreA subunit